MTEQDWFQAADPQPMLVFLGGKASYRKQRLFAVACCRRIWSLLTEQRSRRAVEVAERYADGLADTEQLEKAFREASRADPSFGNTTEAAAFAAAWDDEQAAEEAAIYAAYAADEANCTFPQSKDRWGTAGLAERAAQIELLHCIFGNPFRPVSINPGLLFWHNSLLVSMARRMYDARNFSDMPVLADALEEAGCTNQDMLSHCRQQGTVHVRGCWLVDLLLNKA